MKTKSSTKPPTPAPQPKSQESEETPISSNDTLKAKIAVPLNEDGTIDIGTMREKTKDRLKKALASTPEFSISSGTVAGASAAPMFPPMVVVSLYRSITMIEVLLAQRMAGIPQPIAQEAFTFSEKELEQLIPPTSRIMAKYATEWMLKYQDELALATMLTTMTMAKVNAAIMLSKISQEKTAETLKKEPDTPTTQVQ